MLEIPNLFFFFFGGGGTVNAGPEPTYEDVVKGRCTRSTVQTCIEKELKKSNRNIFNIKKIYFGLHSYLSV